MKTINFTAKEILPSLLNKTKTQTIRKAWKNVSEYTESERFIGSPEAENIMDGSLCQDEYYSENPILKPAKFEVGDEVELIWDEYSGCKEFDVKEGKPFRFITNSPAYAHFNKNLGKVKITEVFKIKMDSAAIWNKEYKGTYHHYNRYSDTFNQFSRLDGFNSAVEFFDYFHKNYDLETPKEFWVYRWEWL